MVYLERRVREMTMDGDTYRAEMRQNRDELKRAMDAIAELRVEVRRLGGGGGGGGFANERARDFDDDDGRPRKQFDDFGRNGAGRQPYEDSPLERRFGRG